MTMVFSYTVPGHILGPNPKGSWEKGWGGVVFSLLHRSGMKRSGWGNSSGSRPIMIWGMIARVCVSGKGQMWNGRSEGRKEEGNTEYVNV